MVHYLVTGEFLPDMSHLQRAKIRNDLKCYVWDAPNLWKFCSNQIIRRYVLGHEFESILSFCHEMAVEGILVKNA